MKMSERRGSTRQKSFLRGCLYFNNRRSTMDCLIRDLSEEGARIIFSHTVNVPEVIELYIPQREQTVRARVKWRHGDEVGLDFSDHVRARAAPEESDLGKRVAQLEADVAALRRFIKQLKRELPNIGDVDAA
jgi:PilZ domain